MKIFGFEVGFFSRSADLEKFYRPWNGITLGIGRLTITRSKQMIVKIQVPLETNDPQPKALIYNEDRSFEKFIPVDADLLEMMDGEPKRFFTMQFVNDDEVAFQDAPWQNW